ncbi:hypothetical protein EGT74_05670 [Chitinophaga lutea]|uniref:Gingipain domain-containing protein n=1 Tax=Chitinophaga lutea TaxID=2488634 RepID=A0A3N4PYQ8_9BACT|nr:type IX secretion system sortase PorU [Chitinophaga lutea]RPE13026.1 hypothetical protein EGT74_05670 [Chitinophaga lutea]
MRTARSFMLATACLLCWLGEAYGQRSYAQRSVLADGSWYKLAVREPGVYRIDLPLLQSMGILTNNLASNTLRIYGHGGGMLPEDNAAPRPDDLPENPVVVLDGGDGILNGNDCILFYAEGPHIWRPTPEGFRHTRHLYADSICYFLQLKPGSLRVGEAPAGISGTAVTTYDYRAFHEKDLYNILSSGKEWFGEELNAPQPERSFTLSTPAAGLTEMHIRFRAVARSTGGSQFELAGQRFAPLPVSGNIFDQYATAVEGYFPYTGGGTVSLRYQGNAAARGWLDYLEIQGRSPLVLPASGTLLFRDSRCAGASTFVLANAGAQTQVWDVSNPLQPLRQQTQLSGSTLRFNGDCGILREYVAFNPDATPKPQFVSAVANQNLHGVNVSGMLVIAPAALKAEAERLAGWHRSRQLDAVVVTVEDIYNEFASGSPDPTALRDFVKMQYDRNGLRYLLLFGRASFMYKDASNMVPTWQSPASLHGINTYMTDDYFGFLGDNDHIGGNPLLDVAIGRLPVRNAAEAAAVVNKIKRYQSPESFGAWRNEMTFTADDEDGNLHFNDAEKVNRIIEQEQPGFNVTKLYLDAFPQVSGASGSRYPAVNDAINRKMFNGTLVWNYNGHGSFTRLAEEAVLDDTSPDAWNNANRLPLLVTATCDFAPFDNPQFHSLGEKLLTRERGGAIALMTTTRAVFASSNLVMNANYFRLAFQPRAGGQMPTLGEGAMLAKNETYAGLGDVVNNRKFQLLGDPALSLAFPRWRVYTDSVNGVAAGTADTLKALGRYTIAGSVRDATGNIRTGYNGTLDITVFDKPVTRRTLGNDPGSAAVDYQQQDRALFRGTQAVQNGRFRFTFVVPKDIAAIGGKGKISYYTHNDTEDGGGTYANLAVTGTATGVPADNQGPVIKAWMNHESFRDGGVTAEDPLLLVLLQDENGINATGNGIGHDIVAVLDDSTQFYNMNEFYITTPGNFREGRVVFPLAGLAPGKHSLTIRAWDSFNNSSTINISFTVVPKSLLAVENVYNYPNPMRHQTRFVFNHNQQNADLDVLIRIFTSAGKQVATIRNTINTTNGRYSGIPWNGTNDSGARLTPGIYFYQFVVRSTGREKVFGGKLILL